MLHDSRGAVHFKAKKQTNIGDESFEAALHWSDVSTKKSTIRLQLITQDTENFGIFYLTFANTENSHPSGGAYQMHILVEPPHGARPGHVLTPATTISLRSRHSPGGREAAIDDAARCWGFLTVVSTDGSTSLAPPSTTLVSGALVASVRDPASDDGNNEEVGQILFQNITINHPGDYRLRISLLRMTDPLSPVPSVRNVGSVLTRIVRVV